MNSMRQLIVFLLLCGSQLWSPWPHPIRMTNSGSGVSLVKLAAVLHECCGLDSLHCVNYYVLINLHTLRAFISTNCECTRFWQVQRCIPQWQFYIIWFCPRFTLLELLCPNSLKWLACWPPYVSPFCNVVYVGVFEKIPDFHPMLDDELLRFSILLLLQIISVRICEPKSSRWKGMWDSPNGTRPRLQRSPHMASLPQLWVMRTGMSCVLGNSHWPFKPSISIEGWPHGRPLPGVH